MNLKSILLWTLFLCTPPAFSQEFDVAPRVLLAGDSWSAFLCGYYSLESVWQRDGVDAQQSDDCYLTTRIGMHSDRWLGSRYAKATERALRTDKKIRIVVLSLGGNDLINMVHKGMPFEERVVQYEYIRAHVAQVIAWLKQIKPGIKIVVSGYDYPRFSRDNKIRAYRRMYAKMGEPDAAELNHSLIEFSRHMSQLASGQDVFYANHLGLMHYYFGSSDAGLNSGITLSPDLIGGLSDPSIVGGWPELQTPPEGMMRIGKSVVDAFHLSPRGFYFLAKHLHDQYLRRLIQNP